ncbi:MAG TPA: cation:proton antiporter, partial [Abditibacteriaceae bacterium]
FCIGALLGWNWQAGLFFGGVISISSTMVILKTLMSRGEIQAPHGRLLLAMLIVQDLAVVFLILLLPRLVQGNGVEWRELASIILKGALFISLTLFLGSRVVPLFLAKIESLRTPELSILTAATLALGTAALSGTLGLSPALGAFLAGLLLTETDFEHYVMARIGPMRDLFATLFFVSIGMLIDVSFILTRLPQVLGLSLLCVLVKALFTLVALAPFRPGGTTLMFTGLGMISLGEFNFLLASAGLKAGAFNEEIYNLVLASALPTIVLTPLFFSIAPRLALGVSRWPLLRWAFSTQAQVFDDTTSPKTPKPSDLAVIIGYGRVGRHVAFGLRRAGLKVAVIENDWAILEKVREAHFVAVYGDASYRPVLRAAGIETARLVVVALPDFGATRAVVHRARSINAEALIMARAQHAEDDVRLREAGASAVVSPELAGAIMLLDETLLLLGLAPETPVVPDSL